MEEIKESNDPREFSPGTFKQREYKKRRGVKTTRQFYKNFGKKVVINTYLTIAILSVIALALCYWYLWCYSWYPQYAMAEVNYNRRQTAQTASPEENIREWVLNEWGKVGQRDQANSIITCESRWDSNAFNINSNRTIDLGLYQINSIHQGSISIKDMLDYKKATEWAIKKYQHDKNWSAWVCSRLMEKSR